MELDAWPSSKKTNVVTHPSARGCCRSCGTRPPAPSYSKGAWGDDAAGSTDQAGIATSARGCSQEPCISQGPCISRLPQHGYPRAMLWG